MRIRAYFEYQVLPYFKIAAQAAHSTPKAIPHNSKCRYGERGAAAAKPKAHIILDAAKVSAASGGNSEPKQGQRSQSARGLLPPKHDAGTATRHYRAFWQRRCRAAAAGAVLKPQGGNCAVLPLNIRFCLISKSRRKPHIQLLTSTSYLLTDFQVLSIMRMAAKSFSKLQRDVSSPRRQAKKLVSSST